MVKGQRPEMRPIKWLLVVDDVFKITGRGAVATGRLLRGIATAGVPIVIYHTAAKKFSKDVCSGLELYCMSGANEAPATSVGVLLAQTLKEEIQPGDLIWEDCE